MALARHAAMLMSAAVALGVVATTVPGPATAVDAVTASATTRGLARCPDSSLLRQRVHAEATWVEVWRGDGLTECHARIPTHPWPLLVLLVVDLGAGARARLVSQRLTNVREHEPTGQYNWFKRRTVTDFALDRESWTDWADDNPPVDDPDPGEVYGGVVAGEFVDRKQWAAARLALHEQREGRVETIGARCWADVEPRGIFALTTPTSGRQRAVIGDVTAGGGADLGSCEPDLARFYDVTAGHTRTDGREDSIFEWRQRVYLGVSNGAFFDDDEAGHDRIYVLTGRQATYRRTSEVLIRQAGAELTLEMASPEGLNGFDSPFTWTGPDVRVPRESTTVPEALVFYPAPPAQ